MSVLAAGDKGSGIFQSVVDLIVAQSASIALLLLVIGGILAAWMGVKGYKSEGGLKQMAITASIFVLAALVLLLFPTVANNFVGTATDVVTNDQDGIGKTLDTSGNGLKLPE
jgi:hypothetical protein